MKLNISVQSVPLGWTLTGSDPAGAMASFTRTLGATADGMFPLPPAGEVAGLPADLMALVEPGDRLSDLCRRCTTEEPNREEIVLFGQFLHKVLFGSNWAAITAAVGADALEIGLEIAPADAAFARLPWEMMYTPGVGPQPLATYPPLPVPGGPLAALGAPPLRVLVRLVSGATSPTLPLDLPLRVLFVVGRQLDHALRPGTEYIGLLRRLGIPLGGKETVTPRISLRVLTETTSDELQTAVHEFQPHVIHFICHGVITDGAASLLLTKREREGDTSSLKTNDADRCGGLRLLGLLGGLSALPQPLPSVVVLNACHSAEEVGEGLNACQSLAASLVAGGVPVVLGMAGAVADGACRLFTRGFYEALIVGTELPVAATRARRAAMLHYGNYETNVEWSRLRIFARDWAATRLAVASTPTRQSRFAAAAAAYIPLRGLTLCDRLAALRAYEVFRRNILTGGPKRALVYAVTIKCEMKGDQFSKTSLLDTITVQAVLDGFIPCQLSPDAGSPAVNLLDFALDVCRMLEVARRRLGLRAATRCETLDHVYDECGIDRPQAGLSARKVEASYQALRKHVRQLPAGDDALNPATVRVALSDDFRYLREDALAEFGVPCRSLVIIDDLHKYEGMAENLLELWMDQDGVALDGTQPVDLIFSYSQYHWETGAEVPLAGVIRDFLKKKSRIVELVELQPIETPEEQRMAYSQYLLACPSPLAVNTSWTLREEVDFFFNLMHENEFKGVPSRFASRHQSLKSARDMATRNKVLVIADDENVLAQF